MEHDLAMAQKAALKSSYHHGDLESALIEAAISLVRKYGPDHLSLRAVSAEVGVSPSAMAEPNLYRLIFGGFCEYHQNHSESKAWKLLEQGLDNLVREGLITKSARQGGEVMVWSAVHGASSLIIEGLMPKNSFPLVIKGVQRSLGMK